MPADFKAYSFALYLGPMLLLALIEPLLSSFQRTLVTATMIWCLFAIAYNLLFGYTGLMSLGHALFFGAGMYAAAFSLIYLKANVWSSLLIAFVAAVVFSALIGFIAIRVKGVYFLIITLIFSMSFYAAALTYPEISGGADGLVLGIPSLNLFGFTLTIMDPDVNYYFVLTFLSLSYIFLVKFVTSPIGIILKAIRENEERTKLIGYNVAGYKFLAFTISGAFSGLAGAMYAFSFRFAGPQLMSLVGSFNVLVWTLVGGAGTILGPLVGTFILILVVDYLSSATSGYLILVGAILVIVIRFAPRGIVGTLKNRLITPRLKS